MNGQKYRWIAVVAIVILLGWALSHVQLTAGASTLGSIASATQASDAGSAETDTQTSGGSEADAHGPRNGYTPPVGHGPNPLVLARQQAASLPTVGGPWQAFGPAPIQEPYMGPKGYTASGRVLSLAIAGQNLYAGSAGGGVWKTSDSGASWSPLTDAMPSPAIGALAIDPTNPSTIYAGTGEPDAYGDDVTGVGIYRTTDGGTSWAVTGANLLDRRRISAIRVDPHQPNVVYASVWTNGAHDLASLGIVVSTNHGKTWSALGGPIAGQNISDLAIDNAGDLYAAFSSDTNMQTLGLIFVCRHRAGKACGNWLGLHALSGSGTPAMVKIALAPQTASLALDKQIVFVAWANGNHLGHLLSSTSGGLSWNELNTGPLNGDPQADADLTVAFDPSDKTSNTVYVGVSNLYKLTNVLTVCSSGVSCNVAKNISQNYLGGTFNWSSQTGVHTDQHALLAVGQTLYVGNDGGIARTTNRGSNFSVLNGTMPNKGLAITQFYSGNIGPTTITGGTQDNGTLIWNVNGWKQISETGDGGGSAIDPLNESTVYGVESDGTPFLTNDDGATSHSGSHSGDPNPAAPLVMDWYNPQTLYVGEAHALFQTADGMQNFDNISPIGPVYALALPRNAPDPTVFAGVGTEVHRVVEQNSAWDDTALGDLVHGAGVPNTSVQSIVVDPQNQSIVYAALNSFDGAQKFHVFRTMDGGTTWTDISTSLPDAPFYSVAVDRQMPRMIVASGVVGVFVSFNRGDSWAKLGTGLPNTAVFSTVLTDGGRHIYAFTHGRGVWRIPMPTFGVNDWGLNDAGQLGDSSVASSGCKCNPLSGPHPGLTGFRGVAVGSQFKMALSTDGTVWTWGSNRSGQLGTGTASEAKTGCNCTSHPVHATQVNAVNGIAAGDDHALAVTRGGFLWTWGSNYDGQLGKGHMPTNTCKCNPLPNPVAGMTSVIAAAGGYGFSLALKHDGTVWAWGTDRFGELAHSSTLDLKGCECDPTPTQIAGLTHVVAIAGGYGYGMALKDDGTVWTWGEPPVDPSLVNPGCQCQFTPTLLPQIDHVVDISASRDAILMLKDNGTVWNTGTQRPDWHQFNRFPTQVPGLTQVKSIAAGDAFDLALDTSGNVWSWGDNTQGQLGDNLVNAGNASPSPVVGLKDATAIAALDSGIVLAGPPVTK